MSIKKPTVKIVNDEIIFSNSVLDYFESVKTKENSEWIDKYFKVLSDTSNINSEKYNIHHIRPCFTFKDENHKNRKDTEHLANKFNENKIKLSVINHFFAHYYLWKIFDNKDSKLAFQRMCGQKTYIDNLTEGELKEVARLNEDCTKENLTDDELKLRKQKRYKNWYDSNKETRKEYDKLKYKNNIEKIKKRMKEYRKNNKEKISQSDKLRYYSNKEQILNQQKEYNNQRCIDPMKGDECTLCALKRRIDRNKDLYKDIIPSNCIIK